MKNPSIAVIGAGAIGMLFAGRMAATGVDVTLWTRTMAQAVQIEAEGIAVQKAGEAESRLFVRAAPFVPHARLLADIVLLTVKQTALTPDFLALLGEALMPGAALIALCNGIGHTDRLAQALPGRTLLAAVTTEGALRVDACNVKHTGQGETWLGPAPLFETEGSMSKLVERERVQHFLRQPENLMKQAGFTVFLSNDMTDRILRKLLMNCVINPLTAILRMPNGSLTAAPERMSLMRNLFEETLPILQAYGLQGGEVLWNELLVICQKTALNRSSMLQDVLAGQATEIDALNGAVGRLASRAGLVSPWNDLLVALIGAMSVNRGDV